MLHAKYESSSPYGLGQEDFFFHSVAMATRVFHRIQFFEVFRWEHDLRIISVKFDWNLMVDLGIFFSFVIVNGRIDRRRTDHSSSPWAQRSFEITLADFFVIFREEFTRISLCLYSASSPHSLIPCLFIDQNFGNKIWKGSLKEYFYEIISKFHQ